ncbi:glutathione S-transferase 1-like [Drosophila subpulchrella]|uniref:glutathione S-transferase 1-like n=1 Tax=Drosophila subpulchrella TaxID=1486046 RepID=UPI0018A1846A|nr:glutathione S-transferase 1-like [Drosophila subpulchrella]
MGKLILYGLEASPPVRAAKLTLAALDVPYEFVEVNTLAKENLSEAFLKKNPQHTVPTLEDDGHFLWDSHAIIAYLVSKYGKTDSLYPKDLLQRAVVDQRLHFESGVIFANGLRSITKPLFSAGQTKIPKERYDAIIEIYDFLETFLGDNDYIAGGQLTIADFSIISTVTSLEAFVELDSAKYPKVSAWIKRLQQLPYYEEANGNGARVFGSFIKKTNFTFST